MQNKGFIKVFAVLLTLVCLFYLSFSFVSRSYSKKAEAYAQGDQVKISSYLDSISTEKVWLGYTLKECREMEINLGLDLKGGMNVILEISVADVIKGLSNNNPDENFNKALELAKKRQITTGQNDYIVIFIEELKKIDPSVRLATYFSTYELKDKVNPQSTNEAVESVIRTEVKDAISNSFNVLRSRIDRFGVVQPNIQELETTGRILIELPGVKEPERVRKLLQGTANLEFWETFEFSEIYPMLMEANNVIASLNTQSIPDTDTAETSDNQTKNANTSVADSNVKADSDSLLSKIEGGQADSTALSREAYEKQFPLFSVFQMNVNQQGQAGSGSIVGYAHSKDTAKVNNYLNIRQVKELFPRNLSLKWGVKAMDKQGLYFELYAIKINNRDGRPALEGSVVTDARADLQENSSQTSVSMTMNAEGAKVWAKLTRENVGKCISIVLDNVVYSSPRVNGEIPGGQSQITGNFTPDEARDLANVLKSGKMSAPAHIIQESVIGPSLGQESINAGAISFVFALLILGIFMVSMYGVVPGMVANTALLLNLFFTLGILASFHAVLTLSGIAGIVLALGMAVDANVLIYERTKEELRSGKGLKKAISDGYNNAFSAIFDSNITSIITGIILFYFGTGPIRGFATTLIIGIICSFFTAVFLTRIVYEYLLTKEKFANITFITNLSKNIFVAPTYQFMEMRKKIYYIVIASVIILGGVLGIRGLNQGIDFTGGRNYVVRFDNPVSTQKLAESLRPLFYADGIEQSAVNVITIGGENSVRISTNYKINDENSKDVDTQIENMLFEGSKSAGYIAESTTQDTFTHVNIVSSEKVGPAIAEDIKTGAFWAVIFSLIAIALYILLRFRNISYSVGTVLGLSCDTTIIVGLYALLWGVLPFSMEVDQTFIGAILTVIGYSVNDKVVIFDRVREFLHLYPTRNRKQLFDDALNTTLSRTINTSLSTFIVLIFIFVLAGDSIRSLAFALILGIVFGTLSSLFIAAPVAYDVQRRQLEKEAEKKKK